MSIPDPESAPEASLIRALSSRFEISSTEESRLEIACRPHRVPTDNGSHTSPAEVGFSAVSTLVCRGKGEISGIGYVVPTFAVHWGVIVRETLFHLRYDSRNKAVQFDWRAWRTVEGNPKHKVDVVGQTPYSTDELIETGPCIPQNEADHLGKKLVEAFGDYQTLFWNCQTFAKVFLRVVCTPPVEPSHWTSADTTYLVYRRIESTHGC
jgi:hypothetical protein